MTKMYKTAFKSNTNQTVLSGGTVTPLPEANGRTNTALGYKQTHAGGGGPIQPPKTNNMMLPQSNTGPVNMGNILAQSSNMTGTVQSRHSDRRDSNQMVNGFRQNHQRKPQLSIDYQTIFSAGSPPNVSGAGLNITELYSHYANANNQKVGSGGNISSTNANNQQMTMPYPANGGKGHSGQGLVGSSLGSQSPNGISGPNA